MPTTYAIPNGRTVMDATTYTANGGSQTINNADNGTTGFKPDFVWTKSRSNSSNNILANSVVGPSNYLYSQSTAAEVTDSTYYQSFNSNGFSLGSGNFPNGYTMVAWQWQAGQGTTSTNNDGNRTSTVSVNASAGFSVVTYTFSTSGVNTVGHGLGVAPAFIIMKDRTTAYNWDVWAPTLVAPQRLVLNSTAAIDANGFWNSAPTSTVFSVKSTMGNNNDAIVAYCWAEIAGFSKFGSYTGNVSADGPFIYTGFRPSFLMIKRTDAASNWIIYDNARNTYNVEGQRLCPNLTSAEATVDAFDFLSNGIKVRTADTDRNQGTIIYAAFAENPFKYANAR